jgi:hypothetical protein
MSMFVYFCLATVLAQAILLAYFGLTRKLDRDKTVQMLAVLNDVDLLALKEEADEDEDQPSSEQPSYEQLLEVRATQIANLQLREQSLKDGLDQLQFEQREVTDKQTRLEQVKAAFDTELLALQDAAVVSGREDVVTKLQGIKAKQAKQLLLDMLDREEIDEVVTILREMSATKSVKIIGEFKSPEELEKIGEVLRRIRQGSPTAELAARTKRQLGSLETGGP